MFKLLQDEKASVTCVWNACDPYTTSAVRGVDGDGSLTNCGRTFKDGIPYRKASTVGRERQLVLHNTPQELGGCKGCRFFFACKGYCPGTALGGDWRKRTEHCRVLYSLFERFEEEIKTKRSE